MTLASETPVPGSAASPPRVLGVGALAFAMFNCIVGASIFKLPAEVAAMLGPAAILADLGCALILALVGLCLAEAGSRVTEAGGLYAYATVAFGPVVGGMVGTLTWLMFVTSGAAVATLWVETLARAWPAAGSGALRGVLVITGWAMLALINIRGAQHGSRLSAGFALSKLVPLLAIALCGFAAIEPANLRWTAPLPAAGHFAEAIVLLFFAFGGVEAGLAASGEVRDPARTIPRAILIAAVLVALLYMSLQFTAQGVLGAELSRTTAPLASVASVVFGPWGARFVLAATLLSTSGYLVADVLCSPRALYALASRGQLPAWLATLHPRSGTPAVAVGVYAGLCALLTLSGSFRRLAVFASSITLLAYMVSCLALLSLRAGRVAQAGEPFRAPGGAALPITAAAVVVALLSALPRVELLAALLPVSLAAAVYALQAWIRGRGQESVSAP